MHAAQPQQPRRAAASAAVPLEYFQCVYSHTTHSALTAASPRSQSATWIGTHLPASVPAANQKPERARVLQQQQQLSSSQSEARSAQQHCSSPAAAAGKQSSILEVQFSITDNLTAVKSMQLSFLRMEHSILMELLLR